MDTTRNFALNLDAQDVLAPFRQEFVISDPDLVYLDGNSLGRLPKRAIPRLEEVVKEEWGNRLIRSWNTDSGGAGWITASRRLGDKIGQLIGASPGQVLVCDSTSVNLFKLALAALALRPSCRRILSDDSNFPSDLYILQGCASLLDKGYELDIFPLNWEENLDEEEELIPQEFIHPDTALVVLSHVAFKSGYLYDIQAITQKAHQAGALILWDLSHSAGVVEIELDRLGVDFAIGCTYKYLNGGPGAPAYLYVRKDLQKDALNFISGWFGSHEPFKFGLDYHPAPGVERFLVGTPPLISMLALEAGLDLTHQAGTSRLREKSVRLTEYLIQLYDVFLEPLGFRLGTPRLSERRGAHVSIRHPEGYRINRALIEEMNVIPDFREPDNLRLGLAPLYISFIEVWEGVQRIRQTILEQRYLHYSDQRSQVT
jgi:kynureninase